MLPRTSSCNYSLIVMLNSSSLAFTVFRQRSNWDINWPRSDTIPWSVTWNEDEAPPGLYTANITFYNQISECSSSTQVQIVQDLYNVTVRSSSGEFTDRQIMSRNCLCFV